MKTVTVLGATGSIGRRTLELIAAFPDQFRVGGLAARGSDVALVAELVRVHRPAAVALLDRAAVDRLARELPSPRPELLGGPEGLAALAADVPRTSSSRRWSGRRDSCPPSPRSGPGAPSRSPTRRRS